MADNEMMVKSLKSGCRMQIDRIVEQLRATQNMLDIFSEKGLRIVGLNLDPIEIAVFGLALDTRTSEDGET